MTPTATPPRTIAPAPRPSAGAPRQQYLELRANVHRKLLNRLNLEALARADRARAESEIRTLLSQLLAEESTPLNLAEREGDVMGLSTLVLRRLRTRLPVSTTRWDTPVETRFPEARRCSAT